MRPVSVACLASALVLSNGCVPGGTESIDIVRISI